MSSTKRLLKEYNFNFPKELIAKTPSSPRDASRLLIYDRASQTITHDHFHGLPKYLPSNSVIVFNETKVLPARLELEKITGGKVRVLYISHDRKWIKILSEKKLAIETRLTLSQSNKIYFHVTKTDEHFYYLKASFPLSQLKRVLEKYGAAPLPLYIKQTSLTRYAARKHYQTIFARRPGSIAAPTASLHFTRRLLQEIKKHDCDLEYVTLHVGLGTFAPLTEENLQRGKLHQEYFWIAKATARRLLRAKKDGRPIIAVGTTVVRALESAFAHAKKPRLHGKTDLFIQPGYRLRMVDHIITNFHFPKSSLLMLVSAFVERKKLLRLYEEAIQKRYRLFSFGDGMLIL